MSCSIPILEIDLKKIRSNYQQFKKLSIPTKLASMVKANAYGLGATQVVETLTKEGCNDFFVANVNEAIKLRYEVIDKNIKIYVLNGVFEDDKDEFYKYNLIPVLNHLGQIKTWQDFAVKQNKQLSAILHVNTGMHRLAMPIEELDVIINNDKLISNIKFEYIISHLTCSEEKDSLNNQEQLKIFNKITKNFVEIKKSLVNSCGVLLGKNYHLDLVRVGAGLYGIGHEGNKNISLQNPVKLSAPILQIQKLEHATPIGYNRTFITKDSTIIATLGLGYADGYFRTFSNKVCLYIENYPTPIVGRISMDLLTIDVSNVPQSKVFIGQMVEVIGEHISPDKIAHIGGTIGYEIITSLSHRYKRVYKNI